MTTKRIHILKFLTKTAYSAGIALLVAGLILSAVSKPAQAQASSSAQNGSAGSVRPTRRPPDTGRVNHVNRAAVVQEKRSLPSGAVIKALTVMENGNSTGATLSFSGSCSGDCQQIHATVCNTGNGKMAEATAWELYYSNGGANNRVQVDGAGGSIGPLDAGECENLQANPANGSGTYWFMAKQESTHPGNGELWSSGCNVTCGNPGTIETATPTDVPTQEPSETVIPTEDPTQEPSGTAAPTEDPTQEPSGTVTPTDEATQELTETVTPTDDPTETATPTDDPTQELTETVTPTEDPTLAPTETATPTDEPNGTVTPTEDPTGEPNGTVTPTEDPTGEPTTTVTPTEDPTGGAAVTATSTGDPTSDPTGEPTETQTPAPGDSTATAEPTDPAEGETTETTVPATQQKTPVPSVGKGAEKIISSLAVPDAMAVDGAATMLMPVTGADFSGAAGRQQFPLSWLYQAMIQFGLTFLGAAFVMQGIAKRLSQS